MRLRKYFGFEGKVDHPLVTLGQVTLPQDLVFELLIRQQSQLFGELNDIRGQLEVSGQVVASMGETLSHVHTDMVELQQSLEYAAKHPVEKVDDQTKQRKDEERKKVN